MAIPPVTFRDRVDDLLVRLLMRPNAADQIDVRYRAHIDIMKVVHPLVLVLLKDDAQGAKAREHMAEWLAERGTVSGHWRGRDNA